jgi:hypothetical protein
MTPAVVKVLRAASILLCVIVALSTLLFALNQTSAASVHQQEQLSSQQAQVARTARESGLHRTIDEVAEEVTSPVSGLVSASSEWGSHAIRLLFALVVYGFGLGFLARALRVHT